MKKIVIILLFGVCTFSAFNQEVSLKEAYGFTEHWLKQVSPSYAIDTITLWVDGNLPMLYFVQLEPSGYLILTGNRAYKPVFGYSLSDHLNVNDLPPGLKESLEHFREKFRISRNQARLPHPDWSPLKQWEKRAIAVVSPLISTQWNQGYPYNAMCPDDDPAGCVAVAMAQLMKFYNYPGHGLSKHAYQSSYGLLEADFENTTYNWENMPDHVYDRNDDIARLIFHCGVSVDMQYTDNSSGASPTQVAEALINYFGYSKTSKEELLLASDSSKWKEGLYAELNKSHPIIYDGQYDQVFSVGHMFIIDGYDESGMFHINWGWGGSADGFYDLDEIVWQYRQGAFLNTYPADLKAQFKTNVTAGVPPLTVTFTDLSLYYEHPVTERKWDFNNDGIVDSESENPIYTYTNYDNYSVKLIVSNALVTDTIFKDGLITAVNPITPKYVSPAGNDSNEGTREKPLKTIQKALNIAGFQDDTIIVENGKYTEVLDFKGKNVTLASNYLKSGNYMDIIQTVLDGNHSGSVVTFKRGETRNARLNGFVVQNGSGTPHDPYWVLGDSKRVFGGGILCVKGSSPTLENLIITNNTALDAYTDYGGAIYCDQQSNFTLRNSLVRDNSSGIFIHSSRCVIDSCIVINHHSPGISLSSGSEIQLSRSVIANNHNMLPYSMEVGGGLNCYYQIRGTVRNCIIYGNTGDATDGYGSNGSGGLYLHGGSNIALINTILYSNLPDEIIFSASANCGLNHMEIASTTLRGGTAAIQTNNNGTINQTGSILEQAPVFQDEQKMNFRLKANSPGIDAGTSLFVINQDTLLNLPDAFVIGTNPDIGVFESGSAITDLEKMLKYTQNTSPEFSSSPVNHAHPRREYVYNITSTDPDHDTLVFSSTQLPAWLALTDNRDGTASLHGTPQPKDTGFISIKIYLSDLTITQPVFQSFTLSVTNTPPAFISQPELSAVTGDSYVYTIQSVDSDLDSVYISSEPLPSWLSMLNLGNGNALLSGIPATSDTGFVSIDIALTDSIIAEPVHQKYTLSVYGKPVTVSSMEDTPFILFPNPARQQIEIKAPAGLSHFRYKIIDQTGKVVKSGLYEPSRLINISNLHSGLYQILLYVGTDLFQLSFIKE